MPGTIRNRNSRIERGHRAYPRWQTTLAKKGRKDASKMARQAARAEARAARIAANDH